MTFSFHILKTTLILCIVINLAYTHTLQDSFTQLHREITTRSDQMQTDVYKMFKSKYSCKDCDFKTFQMLLHQYEVFKRNWVKEMVDFIIKELEIDGDKAQFVRANPEKYFVDYQTFKLLSFK